MIKPSSVLSMEKFEKLIKPKLLILFKTTLGFAFTVVSIRRVLFENLFFILLSKGCNAHKMAIAKIVVAAAAKYIPPPVASPIAATVHKPAAVVRPLFVPAEEIR